MNWENKIFHEVIDKGFPKLRDHKQDGIYWFLPYEVDRTYFFGHAVGFFPLIALVTRDLLDSHDRLKVCFNKKAKEVFKANKGDFREILRHELLHLETQKDEGNEEFERERAKRGIINLVTEVKSHNEIIEAIYAD